MYTWKIANHVSRNLFLFVILAVFFAVIYGFQSEPSRLIAGMLAFTLGYAPVYFLNDFADRIDDVRHGKENAYNGSRNKIWYWSNAALLFVIGVVIMYRYSGSLPIVLLILLYGLNGLYSFRPFRLRDRKCMREALMFVIYFVRYMTMSLLMGFPLSMTFPYMLFVMGSAFAALSVALYKRHIERLSGRGVEYLFGAIAFLSWFGVMLSSPRTIPLLAPLFPLCIFFAFAYKDKQIPIGRYQLGYFLYVLGIFFVNAWK